MTESVFHFWGGYLVNKLYMLCLQPQIRRKSQETMKKAYLLARANVRQNQDEDETWVVGAASVLVINGEKLVIANMGDYRVIVCRNGVAYQISTGFQQSTRRRWYRKIFSGMYPCHLAEKDLLVFTINSIIVMQALSRTIKAQN